MLERLKFWRKEPTSIQFTELNGVTYASADGKIYRIEGGEYVEVVERQSQGDGKAEFIGEGSREEFEAMEREDKGIKGIFGLK